MKKFIITTLLAIVFALPSFAQTENIEQKLLNIGLFATTEVNDRLEIEKLFKNQSKYANSQNMKKLKAAYSDAYRNFDGLSYEDFFKMVEETWDLYKNLKYETIVKNITVNGVYADVEVVETAKGVTKEIGETTKKNGNIASESRVIYNLQKFGKTWKIISDNILSEQTYLLYGEANNIAMDLSSPSQVAQGQQYNVVFDVAIPNGCFGLGSITSEDIIYPQKPPTEVFRNVKKDVALERVLTSNKNNHNEYAIASIGLTKPNITKDKEIHIDIVGMGFLMNRVNVLPLSKGK